jgi:hypothetical protein
VDILYLWIWNRLADRLRGLVYELAYEYLDFTKENEDDTD